MKIAPEKSMNAAALSVAGDPNSGHSHSLRLLAWATLKAERGQTVAQRRFKSALDPDNG